jgi:hypothetical protein
MKAERMKRPKYLDGAVVENRNLALEAEKASGGVLVNP